MVNDMKLSDTKQVTGEIRPRVEESESLSRSSRNGCMKFDLTESRREYKS
jgi:hypothetical protein